MKRLVGALVVVSGRGCGNHAGGADAGDGALGDDAGLDVGATPRR